MKSPSPRTAVGSLRLTSSGLRHGPFPSTMSTSPELATNDHVWFTGLPFELDLDEAIRRAHLDEGVELGRASQDLCTS